MRLAILSDIHGNYTALTQVLARLNELAIDGVVGVGDYLWTTTGDEAVVRWVEQTPGWFVRGNGDSMTYYERCKGLAHADPRHLYESVSALPEQLLLELKGYRILVQHEWWLGETWGLSLPHRLLEPPYVSETVDLQGVDVAVFGDSHLPLHHALPGVLIVHPGSVGAPFDADPTMAKFAILELGPEGVCLEHHAVPFDIHAANREILEGRARDIGHSYYRKSSEIRLRVASPGGEHWEPVPPTVCWRRGFGATVGHLAEGGRTHHG